MKTALVLVAHGSRDAGWVRPLRAIEARTRALRPDLDVKLSFLELMQPTPDESVREAARAGARAVHLAPLFLGQGRHARGDTDALLSRLKSEHPELHIDLLPAVGDLAPVIEAIAVAVAGAVPAPQG